MRSLLKAMAGGALAVLLFLLALLAVTVPILALIGLSSLILMLAWNAVIPAAFHGPHLTFLMAVGSCVLLGYDGNCLRPSKTTP